MNALRLHQVARQYGIVLVSLCCTFGAPPAKPTFGFTILEANGIEQYDATVYSQILRNAIDNTGVYQCLEFSDMSMRLNEQGLPDRCTDAHCAIAAGQILGADFFGFGTIGSVGKAFIISMQIVEVRTGRIIRDISEFHKGKKAEFEQKVIPRFAWRLSGSEKVKK
jgi:hypothetical protein